MTTVAPPCAVRSTIAVRSHAGPTGTDGSAALRRPVRTARSRSAVSPSKTSEASFEKAKRPPAKAANTPRMRASTRSA
ncbi:MAG: hypothetical protein R3A52_23270 [Polyangiales bacterium]